MSNCWDGDLTLFIYSLKQLHDAVMFDNHENLQESIRFLRKTRENPIQNSKERGGKRKPN